MAAWSGYEEFERALRAMGDRLASVSHEISDLLGKLEWHAEAAGPDVRMHARNAAADVVRTQEWLNHRMSQLPHDPGQRYAAMQEMLQVQFVALQKVSTIVNDVLAIRNRAAAAQQQGLPDRRAQSQPLPPLAPPQQGGPFALTQAPQHQQPAHYHGQHPAEPSWDVQAGVQGLLQPQAAPPVRLADLAPTGDIPRTVAKTRSQRAKTGGNGAKSNRKTADKRRGGKSSNWKLALWSGALLGAIVVLGGGGYFVYSKLAGSKSTMAARTSPKKERVSLGDPSARDQALANAEAHDGMANRVPSAPPMAAPPIGDTGGTRGQVPGLMVVQPQQPRTDVRDKPYVAVIATHRDKQALAKIYNDLRKQYPSVLGQKRADGQTVNLGEGGVWHHLILLPPGSREQAEANCAELRAVGYTRCMVRPL